MVLQRVLSQPLLGLDIPGVPASAGSTLMVQDLPERVQAKVVQRLLLEPLLVLLVLLLALLLALLLQVTLLVRLLE